METGPFKPPTDVEVIDLAKAIGMKTAIERSMTVLDTYVKSLRETSKKLVEYKTEVWVSPDFSYSDVTVTLKYRHLFFFSKTDVQTIRLFGEDKATLASGALKFATFVIGAIHQALSK